jgi:hypothetical protein
VKIIWTNRACLEYVQYSLYNNEGPKRRENRGEWLGGLPCACEASLFGWQQQDTRNFGNSFDISTTVLILVRVPSYVSLMILMHYS